MRLRPGLLGMAAALAALLATAASLLWLDHPLSPAGAQRLLQQQVQERLQEEGLSFARPLLHGQTVVLTGDAPDAAASARAEQVTLRATGAGGPWFGGVARVINRLEVSQVMQPVGWFAWHRNGRIMLHGATPASQLKTVLVRRARALVAPDGEVLDQSTVAGASPPPGWERLAKETLHQVARLQDGEARLVGEQLYLLGVGGETQLARVREWSRSQAFGAFRVRLDLALAEGPDDRWGDSAEACRQNLERALNAAPIPFSGAGLAPAAEAALEGLAQIVRRCDRVPLSLSARGTDEAEGLLRARAVAQALLARGVDARNLGVSSAQAEQQAELAIAPQPGTMASKEGGK